MAISNLQMASPVAIANALSNLAGSVRTRQTWLALTNRYVGKAVDVINVDINDGAFNDSDLVDYIAASMSTHCKDGWSYLSTAVSALMDGDYPNAIHTAYYAELRAIMAFLAIQGIGVFDKQHILIRSRGSARLADSTAGTHRFAKMAFDEWLNGENNAKIILRSLTAQGKPLEDWILANPNFPTSITATRQARLWLKDWSLDLGILEDETDYRNFASYRPQNLTLGVAETPDDITSRLRFVKQLWELCAPDGQFSLLLLRKTFRQLYRETLDGRELSTVDTETEWTPMMQDLGMDPDSPSSRYLLNFFKGQEVIADSPIFDLALRPPFDATLCESNIDPMGIIARATLLLRITSQAVNDTLRKAGLTRETLRFWTNRVGVMHGYWDAAAQPADFAELYEDIIAELEEVDRWLDDPRATHSRFGFQQDLRRKIPRVHQLLRAYLWGME